jgi:hypothetical protein
VFSFLWAFVYCIGFNGVLSGTLHDLEKYETEFSESLHRLRPANQATTTIVACSTDDDDTYPNRLDMKYCHLRTDLPIQSQLFDRLTIKETKSVINLFDGIERCSAQKSSKKRSGRNRRRKESKVFKNDFSRTPASNGGEVTRSTPHDLDLYAGLDIPSLHQAVMTEPLRPSRHLNANEWNQKLDGIGSSEGALIIDVRNVYESRVGHFAHPTTPTLLTNTRKYSDLVSLLASSPHLNDDNRKQVFMYCRFNHHRHIFHDFCLMTINLLSIAVSVFRHRGGSM